MRIIKLYQGELAFRVTAKMKPARAMVKEGEWRRRLQLLNHNGLRFPVTTAVAARLILVLVLSARQKEATATPTTQTAVNVASWPSPESMAPASGSVVVAAALSRISTTDGGGGDGAEAAAMVYTKPDECPERDEFAAANAGRTCQRKCETDTDCLNDRKLCLCDGVHCGMSCIRPEKECQELPDPPHGQVHLTGR